MARDECADLLAALKSVAMFELADLDEGGDRPHDVTGCAIVPFMFIEKARAAIKRAEAAK